MAINKAICALLSALVCAGMLILGAADKGVSTAAEPYSALRLHILANSDSEKDQEAKLAVRDAVLNEAKKRFEAENVTTADEARELLLDIGAELTVAAERALIERGMDYGVQLEYGRFAFPDRVYGEKTYPAGDYNALRMILGKGSGHNWWCVMFPPLCIIDEPETPAEYEENGTLKFKSLFCDLIKLVFG